MIHVTVVQTDCMLTLAVLLIDHWLGGNYNTKIEQITICKFTTSFREEQIILKKAQTETNRVVKLQWKIVKYHLKQNCLKSHEKPGILLTITCIAFAVVKFVKHFITMLKAWHISVPIPIQPIEPAR